MKTVNARTQGEDRRQQSGVSPVESLQTGSPVVVELFLTANVQSGGNQVMNVGSITSSNLGKHLLSMNGYVCFDQTNTSGQSSD